MKYQDEYMRLYDDFKANSKFFQAIGNETRQGILLFLIQSGEKGARVNEITENAHLSRPAVSHHLNVLKEAGIIHCRPEGTSHYYYISILDQLPYLQKMNCDMEDFMRTYYRDHLSEGEEVKKLGIKF